MDECCLDRISSVKITLGALLAYLDEYRQQHFLLHGFRDHCGKLAAGVTYRQTLSAFQAMTFSISHISLNIVQKHSFTLLCTIDGYAG